MIITRRYVRKLARAGHATIEDCCTTDEYGNRYRLVTRHDLQRMDHYLEVAQ